MLRPIHNFSTVGLPVMAAIAIGRYGNPDQLSDYNRGREKPSTRKHASEFVFQGPLPKPR